MLLNIFRTVFDWSEVWALFIPLTILIVYKPKGNWVGPVKWYVIVAFLLNVGIDFIWYSNKMGWFGLSEKEHHTWNNNILYNLNSFARLLFFSWFFSIQGIGLKKIARIIPFVFLCAVIIFFSIKKDGFNYHDVHKKSIFYISSYLLATEAGLLLIYCLWYTNKIIREDKLASASSYPIFWIVGGLTLYTSVSFFIFLFYDYLNAHYNQFLVSTWDVHNLLLIILCSCIAIAFYAGHRK
jgi:hypothetical protein